VSNFIDSAARDAIAELESKQLAFTTGSSVANDSKSLEIKDEDKTLGDRGAFVLTNIESNLAALFALFLPPDESSWKPYLSSVSFAYNQKFSNLVRTIAHQMPQELAVQRLGVIHFATSQVVAGLNPKAFSHFLLNLERLLKVHGLHNLMNYAALQLIRTRLSTEFPTLVKTPENETPNAGKRLLKPVEKMGEEIALLISLVLESMPLNEQTSEREYSRVLALYTETEYPRWTGKESGIHDKLEAAYQLMLMQPSAVRESFVQHCVQISESTGELEEPDIEGPRSQLQVFIASLGGTELIETPVTAPLLQSA